jgi:uncharacterized protein (TIGR03067 family)
MSHANRALDWLARPTCIGAVVVAMSGAGFAPVPRPKPKPPAKDDLKLMQGTWVFIRGHKDGVHEKARLKVVWVIEGDRLTASIGGRKPSRYFVRLGRAAAPRPFDLLTKREDKSGVPGRYRLEGDTLTICTGEQRPPDLSGYGPYGSVWVFERQKKSR